MDRSQTIKFFISVSLLGGVCHCWDATVPKTLNAIQGSCVLVPCSTVSYSKVEWYKFQSSGYPAVYSEDFNEIISEFKGRTSVRGNTREGDCSLRINNVKQEDSKVGLYVWIWPINDRHQGFYNHPLYITVLDPVRPEMSVHDTPVVGRYFKATCKFRHSCKPSPPPITWMGLTPISNNLNNRKDAMGLWESTDTATFLATQQDHGQQLSCKSVLNGQYLYSNTESLNVLYVPTDVRIVYSGSSTVTEGNNIALRCISDSRPAPTSFEWIVNQRRIQKSVDPLVIQDVKRHTSVTCIAKNSVGSGQSSTLLLDVQYAPSDVKVDYTGSSTVVEGKKISLRCTSNSRPTPTHYQWRITQKTNTTNYYNRGERIDLQDVKRGTSVSCTAVNSVGQGQSAPLSLSVHYPPSILPGAFCSTSNRRLNCVCRAEAKPSAVISWTVDGSSTHFPDFNTTTQQNGSITVAKLTGPLHYNANCTANNSIGTTFTVLVVHSEGTDLVMPLVGAAGAVVGLCIIVVLVIMVQKKRQRPHGGHTAQNKSHTAQNKRLDTQFHECDIEFDENVYANAEPMEQADKDEKFLGAMVSGEVILSVYILTFLIGLPANTLALYAFIKKLRQKPTPTDFLLINLTISDLLFLLFLPFKMYEVVSKMRWLLPGYLCPLTTFVFFSTIYTSSLLLMSVSVDRYLCVAFPVKYKIHQKPLYGIICSIFIWITTSAHLCFVYIVDHLTGGDSQGHDCYNNFTEPQLNVVLPMRLELCLVLYFLPLIICTFCYARFIHILRHTASLNKEKRRRAVGMAIGTLLVFVVCFLPYNSTHILGYIIKDNVTWRSDALLLSTVNTVFDPITFYFSSAAFQGNLKGLLRLRTKTTYTGDGIENVCTTQNRVRQGDQSANIQKNDASELQVNRGSSPVEDHQQ